jgi:alpha-ribazole phosphatase
MEESHAPETVLWLLRHPEPEPAAAGRCYGSLDWELSEAGIRQAQFLAGAVAAEPIAAIYTSPRQRCRQAARIMAASRAVPVEIVDALRELDFGEFEGRSYGEIAVRDPDLYVQWMEHPTDVRFPGGESFAEMSTRVLAATRALRARHSGQTIVLITHGGVIRIVLADALGLAPANIFRLAQDYGAMNRIRYFGEIPLVERVNTVAV